MIGSSSKRLFTRVLTGSALLAVALAPVACKKDPTAPPLVSAEDLIMPITAGTFAAVSGRSFVIPNGGGELSPELAGQTITVAFATSGTTPTATITSASGTIVADVQFGSCIFVVRSFTGIGVIRIRPGDRLVANPCTLSVNTAGQLVGSAAPTPVTLQIGQGSSVSYNVIVTIFANGRVEITSSSGGGVAAGFVAVSPRTGSR